MSLHRHQAGRLAVTALLVVAAAACTGAPASSPTPSAPPTASPTPAASPTSTPGTDPTASPSLPPTASPSLPPTASPTAPSSPSQSPSAGVVVTFDVEGEQFKIALTSAELIAHAQALLAGGEEGRIPNGLIVRGEPGVNAPWSWHIDPDSLEFADMTMEVCDGLPSHVEDGTLVGDRFCPWGARVVDVQPLP